MANPFVMITGNPNFSASAGTAVNVRSGPGTHNPVAFTASIGATNLFPLAVEPDGLKSHSGGKVYQWVQCRFHDGRQGWLRDDLISVQGDFRKWGYPNFGSPSYLFAIQRGTAVSTPQPVTEALETNTTPIATAPQTENAIAETVPVEAAKPPVIEVSSERGIATVSGMSGMSAGANVNVRSGPGTHNSIAFRTSVGAGNLRILDVQPDGRQRALNRKVYQWAQLQFPDNQIGWIRDDLIKVRADCRPWGYGNYASDVRLFDVVREGFIIDLPEIDVHNQERIRELAFAITSRFEGKGYDAYNNYDKGIVSYGFIQFTLASGSLVTVVNTYLQRSQTDAAAQLRPFSAAIASRDPNLRYNDNLKHALTEAARDPIMQDVQREIATNGFWQRMVDGLLVPRNLTLPLTWALMFDISVNFGINAGFLRRIERDNGLASPTRVPNGITEEEIITQVVELRRKSHYNQAERDNLPGLKIRADFWVHLIEFGDWDMRGLPTGGFIIKNRIIDAANPTLV